MVLNVSGLLIGAYEQQERQPNPFVALDFTEEEEARDATGRLASMVESLTLHIASHPEGDLEVTVTGGSEQELCREMVWKDDMWRLFMEFFRQGERVLLGGSVSGVVLEDTLMPLSRKSVSIEV